MTDPVFRCADHGFATRSRCPVCGGAADRLLSGPERERLSKFLSGALRHFPDDVGLSLDDRGWTSFDALVEAVSERYPWLDAPAAAIAAVVETDSKGRFERDDGRVRAAYGHSVDVSLESIDASVPDALYHGTAPRNRAAVLEAGIRPMGRQAVHLSATVEGAREVGRRHAPDPLVFVVDAAAMLADGRRIAKRGRGTYTTPRVPPTYLAVLDGDA